MKRGRRARRRSDPATEQVRRFALSEGRRDLEALGVYITFLKNPRPETHALEQRLEKMLASALRITFKTPLAKARAFVPLLLRLQAGRPDLVFPIVYLGRLLVRQEDYKGAATLLADLEGEIAGTVHVLNMRAHCAERLGDREDACDLYRASLEKDPYQAEINFRLGRLLLNEDLASQGNPSLFSFQSHQASETP